MKSKAALGVCVIVITELGRTRENDLRNWEQCWDYEVTRLGQDGKVKSKQNQPD